MARFADRINGLSTFTFECSHPDDASGHHVDNIIKPILDALETVVYVDDEQVHKVICEKLDLTSVARIQNPSPLLATAFEKYTELLHIIVLWEEED